MKEELARKLSALSPQEKRKLLAQLLSERIESTPLSHGQRALWFLHHLAPTSSAYNLLYAARLCFEADLTVLQRSVNALIQRYPLLTATYSMVGKEPMQHLHKERTLQVETEDATSWSREVLQQRIEKEANSPFNLEKGPLLRVTVYRRSPQEAILSLTIHHIIADLWSLSILVDELVKLYAVDGDITRAQLPPVSTAYAEYVRWQNEMLSRPEGERHWQYWQQQLNGDLPELKLPTDRPRPPVQTYNGASQAFQLSNELSQRLRQRARAENVTLYTFVLTVFNLLLFNYSDQGDQLVGTPMSGRNRPEDARTVGYFANPVVLRTKLAGNPLFRDVLKQVRSTVIEALEHQDYPFPLLVERLQLKRNPSYSPLIQTLFIWDKPEATGETDPSHALPQFEPFIVGQQGAPFDLTLTIFEVGDTLSGDFHYNVDLFDEATIVRMGKHFQALLEAAVAAPQQHILDLSLLTRAERQQILVTWNATEADFPSHASIHQLFEEQVQRTPTATAVIYEQTQLTYAELNKRANRVAHALQSLGAGPDTFVGVAMERSIEMVVALLAVLKAGAAYVPLEPTYPRERLAYMIENAEIPIVLTQEPFRELLPKHVPYVLNLDSDARLLAEYADDNPVSRVTPDHLMYMIYTSGSTGRPKGVMNIHRAVNNRLSWMQQEYKLTSADRVMQKTPFSFDVSVWEFFWPLLNGAQLVVARPRGHQDPAYLISLIEKQQISTLHFVPSMLHAFLEQPGVERCTSLKRVICSGEALPYELQKRFFSRLVADLYNLYGPTEAAIDVTHWRCQRYSNDNEVPIGHPISNVQLYILNRAMQPVPVGVAGELYIGGVGLARGYFKQPELTPASFLPDPFSDRPGARLFKTGDLARYRPDGAIVFLGRIDQQVKIGGVRIELGEIEYTLAQHPTVGNVLVLAREDTPGNKRLVAYLVVTQPISVEELRGYLKERLPRDMLPSAFVFLDALPVSANGKVDRAALPAPDSARPELEAIFVAPRTELERQLVHIWQGVLGIERIGIQDNFFDLGGASIQSLEVVNKAKQVGIALSPEMLFEYQTIAELAARAAVSPRQESSQQAQRDTQAPVKAQAEAEQQRSSNREQGNMLIESVGVYLPPRVVSTREVLEQCSRPIRFPLEQLTGIKNRRMAGETEFAFDLAKNAIAHCLANSKYNPADIDLLICTSISRYNGPDFHITFEPGTATLLRNHFGFSNALAFDISNACTGMFTGMYIVDAFLKAGLIRRGLVVSGEYITHLTKTAQHEIDGYMDSRMACLTVGDAGAAVILEATADKMKGFHEFEMYSLGRYYDLCIAKASDSEPGGAIMYTDSVKVSAVNIQQAVAHAANIIERSGWPEEAFQHVIMHQTSKMTIYDAGREVNRYLGREVCHEGNLISNVAERGNTASTTHFVALMDSILSNRIKSDSNIIFSSTGSGVNIATAIYTLDDLPERLQRASTGGWKPAKIDSVQARFVPLLPNTGRVRIESIGTLSIAAKTERKTLDMVRVAVEECLQTSSHTRSDLDLLIYAGVYRDDFICEPAIAAMVAGTLGINDDLQMPQDKKMFSFDILNGPVGFLNACYTSIAMMKAQKASTALVVASEVENNCGIPGTELRGIEETASAVILDEDPEGKTGFGNFVFKYFPEYENAFSAYTQLRGSKAILHCEREPDLEKLYQHCIREAVQELLSIEQLNLARIKVVLPPQISSSFIDGLSKVLEVERDRFVDVSSSHDLFTSSLPYALQHVKQGDTHALDIALIIAVSPGIQVGCATYYL